MCTKLTHNALYRPGLRSGPQTGAPLRTPLVELKRSPNPLAYLKGATLQQGKGKGEKGRERKRKGTGTGVERERGGRMWRRK